MNKLPPWVIVLSWLVVILSILAFRVVKCNNSTEIKKEATKVEKPKVYNTEFKCRIIHSDSNYTGTYYILQGCYEFNLLKKTLEIEFDKRDFESVASYTATFLKKTLGRKYSMKVYTTHCEYDQQEEDKAVCVWVFLLKAKNGEYDI